MDILERLYDGVAHHLGGDTRDWQGFADGFRSVFGAEMVLYRALFENGPETASRVESIATSNPEVMREYLDRRIYDLHPVSEGDLAPLEPNRRTDIVSDEAFVELGELADFLIPRGMFYQMVVPAVMSDGSILGLYVWRDREAPDFDDLEKQRLALLMRHLLAVLNEGEIVPGSDAGELAAFGAAYGLTGAEIEIMAGLLRGESLREIAEGSGRTYGTVRWHVQNILTKCQVSTQRGLLNAFYRLIRR